MYVSLEEHMQPHDFHLFLTMSLLDFMCDLKAQLIEFERLWCFCSPSQNGKQFFSKRASPIKFRQFYEGSHKHSATLFVFILGHILSIFYSCLKKKAHHYARCVNRRGFLVLLGVVLLAEVARGGNNYSLSWTAADRFPLCWM